jgi:hypothetical protein
MNTNPNQNKMTFTPEELDNILTLIDFHDDYEEVKEIWGFDIETLRNKVSDLLTNSNEYTWGSLIVKLVPMFGCDLYKASDNELIWVYDVNQPDDGYHVPARKLF